MNLNLKEYFGLLGRYLKQEWITLVTLTTVILAGYFVNLRMPLILGDFIDAAAESTPVSVLNRMAILYLFMILANQLLTITEDYLTVNMGWRTTNSLRKDLTAHALSLDMAFHKRFTPGEMLERVDGDISTLFRFFTSFISGILKNLGLSIFLIGYLMIKDLTSGLIVATSVILIFGGIYVMRVPLKETQAELREREGKFSGSFGEYISSIEDIRTFRTENFFIDRLSRIFIGINRWMRREFYLGFSLSAWEHLSTKALTIIVLIYLAYSYSVGAVTIGAAYSIFAITRQAFSPLRILRDELTYVAQTKASVERIQGVLSERRTISEGTEEITGSYIEVRDVTFSYEDGETVLDKVSFTLKRGQVLGILGRTGSGKTTLARLLVKLYEPQKGSIMIGGTDLKVISDSTIVNHTSYITQETEIFTGTLRDNLTLLGENVSDDQIMVYIERLGIKEWFSALKDGLDTEISRDNPGMSDGELQLLSILRVFIKNPDLVILDEATANIDPVTERYVENALNELLKDRTVIIIAHRLKTVMRADRIMILSDGRIKEEGDLELLRSDESSIFRNLLKKGLEEVLV